MNFKAQKKTAIPERARLAALAPRAAKTLSGTPEASALYAGVIKFLRISRKEKADPPGQQADWLEISLSLRRRSA
jgi:hypothetical protein